ncbi:MAG: hypothetical protein GY832_02965 [Chloroflexi bacterium]|nr:hypothetical protein [Chloroflexota bacterium]
MQKLKSKKALIIILICLVGVAILGIAVLKVPRLKSMARNIMQATGIESMVMPVLQKIGLAEPPWDERMVVTPIGPSDRISARRFVVADLHKALVRSDFEQAAQLNSILAQEAFQRAHRAMEAWKTMRDEQTGLVPKSTHPRLAYWDPEDVAADLFPFLLLSSQYLDRESEVLWLETLSNEREICGPMPCSIELYSGQVIDEEMSRIIFSASEYAKDGVLAVSERFGQGPWFDRMEEIMNALIDAAYVETEAGKISDRGTEANGEMLQVLSRLYWATGNDRYLEMAERIAEAYLFDVFPKNRYLPATYWDFDNGQPQSDDFRLRDHGSEIAPGLVELYLLEKLHERPQAQRYREPLKLFLDAMLALPRTDDGLWYNSVDARTGDALDARPVDTWGYLLLGYQTFDMVEGSDVYQSEIERVMRAAASRKSFAWEEDYLDGYADTIESMLYLLPWHDIPECHRWVDDEIEVMLDKQDDAGFIEQWYLDGNYIRTALLYATYKTKGITLGPWQEDVRLGAAYDSDNRELYVHLSADTNWEGVLQFDVPRHQMFWNLPFEYPRLNGTPEWFTVESENTYIVVNLDADEESTYSGQQLAAGLTVNLSQDGPDTLRLKIVEQ